MALPAGSLRARATRGTFWSIAGAGVSQGLALGVSMIVARVLGREGFGELGMVTSTVGMFGVFAGLRLGTTATKYVAELRVTDPGRAGRILSLSLWTAALAGAASAVLFLAAAPALSRSVLNAPYLASALRLGCALLFVSTIDGAQTGALAGFEAFRAIARVSVIRALATVPIMVAAVSLQGVNGAVGGMAVAASIGLWLNHRALRRECRAAGIATSRRGIADERPVLWRFSLPAFLAAAMVGPITWVGNTLLVNQPNGYAEMGLLNAAAQWRTALAFVPSVLASVALPMLSNLYGRQSLEGYRKVFWTNVALVCAIAVGAGVPIIVASGLIMSAYGAEFADGGPVLATMAVAAALSCSLAVVGTAIASMGRMWHGFVLNCVWAAAFIWSAAVFTRHGAIGLALAYAVSYAVHLVSVGAYTVLAMDIVLPRRLRRNRQRNGPDVASDV